GVDLNRCVTYPHTANVLQFVCGLGPRKASHLLKFWKQSNSHLENRTYLVVKYKMGRYVFSNCAGFIKINTSALADSESYIEILDSTRVHPEAYDWARKMAVDALEYEDSSEIEPSRALEEIFENPERLKELDLDAFATELQKTNYGDQSITLYDIRAELTNRYKDLRIRYEQPTKEDLFHFITKETPLTFYVGKMIQCQVCQPPIVYKKPSAEQLENAQPDKDEISGFWKCPFCHIDRFQELKEVWDHFDKGSCEGTPIGVRTRLDNGCTGFISLKNLSDTPVRNPNERVRKLQVIYSRIMNINIERFSVELTCKTSDLKDAEETWRPKKDQYYDKDEEDKDLQRMDKEKQIKQAQASLSFVKRVIAHPSFMNVNYKDCERLLMTRDLGDAIIRPSSKANDHLTITWKLVDGVLHNIDVIEKSKPNSFSLGKRLLIVDPRTQEIEEFEDLDEILARYIKPMANFVADIVVHKYYRNLSQPVPSSTPASSSIQPITAVTSTQIPPPNSQESIKILNNLLCDDKRRNPTRIRYYITISSELPTKFLLSYMPTRKPIHEYFTIQPTGIRFRTNVYPSLNDMLNWFKIHYADNQVTPSPITRSSRHHTSTVTNTPAPPIPTGGSSSRTPTGSSSMSLSSTPVVNPGSLTPAVTPSPLAAAIAAYNFATSTPLPHNNFSTTMPPPPPPPIPRMPSSTPLHPSMMLPPPPPLALYQQMLQSNPMQMQQWPLPPVPPPLPTQQYY
ncbi:unnamed protein product, partial [Didymodactylos carnosus]